MRIVLFLFLSLSLSGCMTLAYGVPQLNPIPRIEYSNAIAGAKRGDIKAQAKAGEILYWACFHHADAVGWRPPCDKDAAIKWNKSAGENGNAKSSYLLGQIYRHEEAYIDARTWFQRSAEGGYGAAAGELGRLYQHGMGVQEDWKEAYFWFGVSGTVKSANYVEMMRSRLSPADLASAEARIAEWKAVHPMSNDSLKK